jgi:hypothetical protein
MIEVAIETHERVAREGAQSWLAADSPSSNAVLIVQQLV